MAPSLPRQSVPGASYPALAGVDCEASLATGLFSRRELTTCGSISQPQAVRVVAHTRFVDKGKFTARAVLSQNVKALKGKASQNALKKRSGVAQATIGRMLTGKGENARIGTVEALARSHGLEAWQLLVPGMDPSNPPVLQPVSKEERELYKRLKDTAHDLAKLGK